MGSNLFDDEQPIREQCLTETFWIGKHEVTNEQFGSIGCADTSSEPNQPRNCVTWFEAHDFCQSLGLRLPTEVEWEYAARGPQSLVYPWGNLWEPEKVGYAEVGQITSIGSLPDGDSWVGAMDMSGNVQEWVDTPYLEYPASPRYEGNTDDVSRRVLRGGNSWGFMNADLLRSSWRDNNSPNIIRTENGFRCARS